MVGNVTLEFNEILMVLVKKDLEVLDLKARLAESAKKLDESEERVAKLEARVVELLAPKPEKAPEIPPGTP